MSAPPMVNDVASEAEAPLAGSSEQRPSTVAIALVTTPAVAARAALATGQTLSASMRGRCHRERGKPTTKCERSALSLVDRDARHPTASRDRHGPSASPRAGWRPAATLSRVGYRGSLPCRDGRI